MEHFTHEEKLAHGHKYGAFEIVMEMPTPDILKLVDFFRAEPAAASVNFTGFVYPITKAEIMAAHAVTIRAAKSDAKINRMNGGV